MCTWAWWWLCYVGQLLNNILNTLINCKMYRESENAKCSLKFIYHLVWLKRRNVWLVVQPVNKWISLCMYVLFLVWLGISMNELKCVIYVNCCVKHGNDIGTNFPNYKKDYMKNWNLILFDNCLMKCSHWNVMRAKNNKWNSNTRFDFHWQIVLSYSSFSVSLFHSMISLSISLSLSQLHCQISGFYSAHNLALIAVKYLYMH